MRREKKPIEEVMDDCSQKVCGKAECMNSQVARVHLERTKRKMKERCPRGFGSVANTVTGKRTETGRYPGESSRRVQMW